jgi:hypothetical protein
MKNQIIVVCLLVIILLHYEVGGQLNQSTVMFPSWLSHGSLGGVLGGYP